MDSPAIPKAYTSDVIRFSPFPNFEVSTMACDVFRNLSQRAGQVL